MLIETDVLLAAMNARDPLRPYGIKAFEESDLVLSPFTFLEIDLLRRARKIEVKDFQAFAQELSELVMQRDVRQLADNMKYHYEASLLQKQFHLTFFDSLHAAVSKVERENILSFDGAYDRLVNTGIKRLDPREL